MKRKIDIRKKRREKRQEREISSIPPDQRIAIEKQKARDLRHSPWWKKKISAGVCYYCRGKFKPEELTMDHLVPLARGGKSEKANLVPACKDCNSKKKYSLPFEWEEFVRRNKNSGGDRE